MKTAHTVKAGIATDRGLERDNNEDRIYVDQALGLYLVVDGIGGEAAGEKAAEVAARVIAEVLGAKEGEPADRVRQAIASANNEIFQLAQQNEEWRGMACVLTLVVAHGDRITVGHVGDTRLYLAWDGKLRKLTPDHAPVGEQEDLGELTEEEAMRHPRRNEVFRDVGSRLRQADDNDFIEVRTFRFRDDAAFLLCSDGLSDAVTAAGISAIVETYDGNPEDVARRLVDAANHAGGRDNVSVVFVAGPEFTGIDSRTMLEARSRHAITRPRPGMRRWRAVAERGLWLLAGVVIGALIWEGTGRVIQQPAAAPAALDATDPHAIQKAMSSAKAGETVMVPAGQFLGPIELKDGVTLLSATPRGAIIRMDPLANGTGGTAAVIARGMKSGRFGGFRIVGDATSPLSLGVLAQSANVEIDDLDISGATDCGVRMEGTTGVLRSSYVHDNAGCGVWIGGEGVPRLTGNRISGNGTGKDSLRSGIEIHLPSQPLLENNIIRGNGLASFGDISAAVASEIRNRNVTDEAKLPE